MNAALADWRSEAGGYDSACEQKSDALEPGRRMAWAGPYWGPYLVTRASPDAWLDPAANRPGQPLCNWTHGVHNLHAEDRGRSGQAA